MKVNFSSLGIYVSLRFIILFLSVIFNVSRAIAQFGIPYQSEPIDASVSDTSYFSPCRFPYSVSNKAPGSDETVQWTVIKGTASLLFDDQSQMQVRDIKGDIAVVKYTIFTSKNIAVYEDTLFLVKDNSLPCNVIDRSLPHTSKLCGDTLNLFSNLPQGYTYRWSTSSPYAEIINGTTSRDLKVMFKESGSYTIIVNAVSQNNYNSFYESYNIYINCVEADAGPNLNLIPCQLPYILSGNAFGAIETVKWEVVNGSAQLQNETSNDLIILDITSGTQLKYTITKWGLTKTDTVTIDIDSNSAIDCNPVISNTNPKCGDTVTINFDSNLAKQYYISWEGSLDLRQVENAGARTKFKVEKGGGHKIEVNFRSYNNGSSFVKWILLNADCSKPLTKADAGNDITISPCQFPFELKGNLPESWETAKWEVIPGTGTAFIQDVGYRQPIEPVLLDAENGVRLKYTISNGNDSSSDTLTVFINNDLSLCEPSINNLEPNCRDTVKVYFPIWSYEYTWTSEGITPIFIPDWHQGYAEFVPTENKEYFVNVTIRSPYDLHTISKSFTIRPKCSPITQANAGTDTTTHCVFFMLNANSPGQYESGKWKVISGNAFTPEPYNPKSPLIIRDDKAVVVLVWTIYYNKEYSSDTIIVTVNNPLKVSFPYIKNESCGKSDGTVQVAATGGLPPYSFLWEDGISSSTRSNLHAGSYNVAVTDGSGCIIRDTARISDICNEENKYIVEGNVYGGGILYENGLALLISQNESVPVPVNRVVVKNGYYKFTEVEKGDYTVYVLPYKDFSLTILDDYFLPTYYVNKVNLATANPIQVKGNTYSVDIKLASRKQWNMGPNNVQANIDIKNGIPVSTLPVLLFNENDELVDVDFLNTTSVAFENLASGRYYMHIPVEGVGYKNTELFDVNSSTTVISIDTEDGTITGNKSAIFNSIQAYPNPFTDILIIDAGNLDIECKAKLIELVSAKEIKEFTLTSGQNQVNTDELTPGSYILQIVNRTDVVNVFLIKH